MAIVYHRLSYTIGSKSSLNTFPFKNCRSPNWPGTAAEPKSENDKKKQNK